MGDLHLSFSTNKPMDIFGARWERHAEKIHERWCLEDDDTIVLAGDTSWAMNFAELEADFDFLSSLKGRKIILKGNHDYWWTSQKKMSAFAEKYGNIEFLHNNTFETNGCFICGTRGWLLEPGEPHDDKIIAREVCRLKMSLDAWKKTGSEKEAFVFLHYPPLFADVRSDEIMAVLLEYGVKNCYYGHLHGGVSHGFARIGVFEGINMQLASADYLNFSPYKIL